MAQGLSLDQLNAELRRPEEPPQSQSAAGIGLDQLNAELTGPEAPFGRTAADQAFMARRARGAKKPTLDAAIEEAAKEVWGRSGFEAATRNFWNGIRQGSAALTHDSANLTMLLNRATELAAGPDGPTAETARDVEDYFRRKTAEYQPTDLPQGFGEKVWFGLGTAPSAIAKYGIFSRVLGPILGFGAADALSAADQGGEKALEAGGKGVLLGGAFKGVAPLTRGVKVPAMAAIGGAQALTEPNPTVEDVTAAMTVMGTLGGLHGGPVNAATAARNFVETLPELPRPPQRQDPPARVEPPPLRLPPQAPETAPGEAGAENAPTQGPGATSAGAGSGRSVPPPSDVSPPVEVKVTPPAPSLERTLEAADYPAVGPERLRQFRVSIPDENHAMLVDYGLALERAERLGDPKAAELVDRLTPEIYRRFEPYVLDEFRGIEDVPQLARDYLTELREASSHARYIEGGEALQGHLVIDPDAIGRYIHDTGQVLSFDANGNPVPRAPGSPNVSRETQEGVAITPSGSKVGVRYELVDLRDLIASHSDDGAPNPAFPPMLQPRDRTRAASQEQIGRMAGQLEPELLGRSATAADGAPIVGPDGIVESGNARVMAIRRAYAMGLPGGQRYRDWLAAQGYDVAGLEMPVLIRRRTTELDQAGRELFVREANQRSVAAMSPVEIAALDAAALPPEVLDRYAGGDIGSAGNRRFVSSFIESVVPPSERPGMQSASGELTPDGLRRIQAAVFAKAYDDIATLRAINESLELDFKGLAGVMMDMAPAWARMRGRAADGVIEARFDTTPDLMAAVRLLRQSRESGRNIREILGQGDLFGTGPGEAAVAWLAVLYKGNFERAQSIPRMREALAWYIDQANRQQPNLNLGDRLRVEPVDLIRLAKERVESDLFGDKPTPPPAGPKPPPPAPPAGNLDSEIPTRLYRGYGRVDRAGPYADKDAAVPILGPGRYYAFDRTEALRYGPKIEERPLNARNPLVIRHDAEWHQLARDAGWRYANPFGQTKAELESQAAALQALVRQRGHDAIVVYWDKTGAGDVDPLGRPVKTLRKVFGDPQAFFLERDAPEIQGQVQAMNPAGPNYVGFIRQRFDPAQPRDTTEPLRREAILRELVRDLNSALYTGRIRQRNWLGFFRRPVEEVRIRNWNDIETAAHEIAHLIDFRVPEIKAMYRGRSPDSVRIRTELRGVSYDVKSTSEGFAEFIRLWMTQPAEAAARAPHTLAWWERFITGHPTGPALFRARDRMAAWWAQHPLSTMASKIGPDSLGVRELFRERMRSFRQSTVDDFDGFMRAERSISGELRPLGLYKTARLFRGMGAYFEGTLLYGAPWIKPNGSHGFVGKGLYEILRPVRDRLDDWILYITAKSAAELKAQGRENLFTAAEIKAGLALENPTFARAYENYRRWNYAFVNFAVKKGALSREQVASWNRHFYVPFYRTTGATPAIDRKVMPGAYSGIRALTGGTGNVRDILGNMVRNAHHMMELALSNEVRIKAADLASQTGGARFMAKIGPDNPRVKVLKEDIFRSFLDNMGVRDFRALPIEMQIALDRVFTQLSPVLEVMRRNQQPKGDNLVAVLRKGKPEYWEVGDPLFYRAYQSIQRAPRHWLLEVLNNFRRFQQQTITLSADFMAANIGRDTLMGAVMSNHGFKAGVDSARGMVMRLRTDPAYKEAIANGLGYSGFIRDSTALRRRLDRFYSSKGISARAVMNSPLRILDGLERVGEAFEIATRLGEYRRSRAAGEEPRQAAYAGREISTDFDMRGDSRTLAWVYDSIVFIKAAAVSMDRLARGVSMDPNRASIAWKTAGIALFSMGLYYLNHDNELYDQLPDWDKDLHWHFFVPTPEALQAHYDGRELPPLNERYTHLRMPKIWEIGAVASLAERTVELYANPEVTSLDTARNMMRVLSQTFRLELAPAPVKPLAELATGERSFSGQPIEPSYTEKEEPWRRRYPEGSLAVRDVAEATRDFPKGLRLSPAEVEHLIRGYLNAWGGYALATLDWALYDEIPEKPWSQMPGARRYIEDTPTRTTRFHREFWDLVREINETKTTARALVRAFEPQLAEEYEKKPELQLSRAASAAEERATHFNKMLRLVVSVRDIDTVREIVRTYDRFEGADIEEKAQAAGAWDDIRRLKMLALRRIRGDSNQFLQEASKRLKADLKRVRQEPVQ